MFAFISSLCGAEAFRLPNFLRCSPDTERKSSSHNTTSTQTAPRPSQSNRRNRSLRKPSNSHNKETVVIAHLGIAPHNPFATSSNDTLARASALAAVPYTLRHTTVIDAVSIPLRPRTKSLAGRARPSPDDTHSRVTRATTRQRRSPKPFKRRIILAFKRFQQPSKPRVSGRFSYVPPGFTVMQGRQRSGSLTGPGSADASAKRASTASLSVHRVSYSSVARRGSESTAVDSRPASCSSSTITKGDGASVFLADDEASIFYNGIQDEVSSIHYPLGQADSASVERHVETPQTFQTARSTAPRSPTPTPTSNADAVHSTAAQYTVRSRKSESEPSESELSGTPHYHTQTTTTSNFSRRFSDSSISTRAEEKGSKRHHAQRFSDPSLSYAHHQAVVAAILDGQLIYPSSYIPTERPTSTTTTSTSRPGKTSKARAMGRRSRRETYIVC